MLARNQGVLFQFVFERRRAVSFIGAFVFLLQVVNLYFSHEVQICRLLCTGGDSPYLRTGPRSFIYNKNKEYRGLRSVMGTVPSGEKCRLSGRRCGYCSVAYRGNKRMPAICLIGGVEYFHAGMPNNSTVGGLGDWDRWGWRRFCSGEFLISCTDDSYGGDSSARREAEIRAYGMQLAALVMGYCLDR